jgi:hypothetical protein
MIRIMRLKMRDRLSPITKVSWRKHWVIREIIYGVGFFIICMFAVWGAVVFPWGKDDSKIVDREIVAKMKELGLGYVYYMQNEKLYYEGPNGKMRIYYRKGEK